MPESLDQLRKYEKDHLAEMEMGAQNEGELVLREIYKPKADRIKKYEETLKERIKQGDPMLDITEREQISTYISRKYRELGISENALRWVREILEPESKNQDKDTSWARSEEVSTNGLVSDFCGINSANPQELDNSQLVDRDEYLSEEEKKLKAKLALVRDEHEMVYNESHNRKLQLPSQKVRQVTTQKPEAGESLLYLSIGRGIEKLKAVQETVYEFPPKPEQDGELSKSVDSFFAILDGDGDTKWTKDIPAWVEVQITHEQHGKHAAAVKHGIVLPDGTRRNLTREQVGDNAEEILTRAKNLLSAIPIFSALARWHSSVVEPRVAARKVELGPKLSERA